MAPTWQAGNSTTPSPGATSQCRIAEARLEGTCIVDRPFYNALTHTTMIPLNHPLLFKPPGQYKMVHSADAVALPTLVVAVDFCRGQGRVTTLALCRHQMF